MKLTEESICYLEEHIPEIAELALKQAYWQTLASGYSVLESRNDNLVRVFPDGTTEFIKKLPPRIKVIKGQLLEIKWAK